MVLVGTLGRLGTQAQEQKTRHPRLFFVSSSSTTTACGRKKRAFYTDPVTGEEDSLDLRSLIKPELSSSSERDDEESNLIESGKKEYEREGKFLLYWKTTTTTSTFTTYTATTTLGALECTPSSFGISQCPSNGKK